MEGPATAGVLAREVDVDVAGPEGFFGASFFAFPNQSLNSRACSPSRTLPCRAFSLSRMISSIVRVSRLFVLSLMSFTGSEARRSLIDWAFPGEVCDEEPPNVVVMSTAPPGSFLPALL